MVSILSLLFSLGLLGLLGWTLVSALKDTIVVAKKMHEIPCANCLYFTDDHRLKCTLHPKIANTEQAIACRDYRTQNRMWI
jgi:hypothetical protein